LKTKEEKTLTTVKQNIELTADPTKGILESICFPFHNPLGGGMLSMMTPKISTI